MKTTICFLAIYAAFAFSQKLAAQAPHYEITGNIEGAEGVKFYLHEYTSIGRDTLIQSDTIAGINGTFKFSGTVEYPVKVRLSEMADYNSPYLRSLSKKPPRGNEAYIDFFLENSKITITGRLDSFSIATVSGSRSNDEYSTIDRPVRQLERNLNRLARDLKPTDFQAYMNNTQIRQDSISGLRKTLSRDFIKKYPKSFAAPVVLNELVKINDVKEEEIDSFISAMDPQISKLPIVTRIKSLLEKFGKEKATGLTKNLWVKEAKQKDWPGGKDIIIKTEETERHNNYSILKTIFPPGTSELSGQVNLSNLTEFAICSGKQYFIILKDWPGTDFKTSAESAEGSMFIKVGLSDSRDIDLKKVFGDDINEGLTRRDFSSVLSFYMIDWLDLKEPPKPWSYK